MKQVKFTVVLAVDNDQDVEQLHRDLYDVINTAMEDDKLAEGSATLDLQVRRSRVTLL
jgi:hypothetical protein